MNIETDFSIGDTVFYMKDEQVLNSKVKEIYTHSFDNFYFIVSVVQYKMGNGDMVKGEECASTLELLQELIERNNRYKFVKVKPMRGKELMEVLEKHDTEQRNMELPPMGAEALKTFDEVMKKEFLKHNKGK